VIETIKVGLKMRKVLALVLILSMVPALARAAQDEELNVTGPAKIFFPNSLSYSSDNYRKAFESLLETTIPHENPNFGGIDNFSPTSSNYNYNSAPFGNCGRLNAMGAGALAYKKGSRYRFRSGVGHVISELNIGKKWYVVETYGQLGNRQFIKNEDEDDGSGNPFFSLDELTPDPRSGEPSRILKEVGNKNIETYYSKIAPPPKREWTPKFWLPPEITIQKDERLTLRGAGFTGLDLLATGSLPGRRLADKPMNTRTAELQEAQIRRPLDVEVRRFRVEQPFLLFGVSLAFKKGAARPQTVLPIQAYDTLKVYPAAPKWAVPLQDILSESNSSKADQGKAPGGAKVKETIVPSELGWRAWIRNLLQYVGLRKSQKKTVISSAPIVGEKGLSWLQDWTFLGKGKKQIGRREIRLEGEGKNYSTLKLNTSYVNRSEKKELIWVPFFYRSDTPIARGDGNPVAQVQYGSGSYNVYPRRRSFQYADIIVPLEPGEALKLKVVTFPGKSISIYSIGEPANVSDVISPESPLMAADIDWSGLSEEWVDIVELEYKLMVNPFFKASVEK